MDNAAFLSAMFNYYSNFGRNTLVRMTQAAHEIRERKYGPDKLLSDTLGFWIDGSFGWWSSLLASAGGEPPVIFFRVRSEKPGKPGQKTKSAGLPCALPKGAVLSWTDIVRIGDDPEHGHETRIDKDKIECSLNDLGDQLTVVLKGIQGHKTSLAPGQYQGLVSCDDKLVAMIQLEVNDQ